MPDNAEVIDQVVKAFYDKAKSDILIGYHFRHIRDFDLHIPKIQRFWYLVLLPLSPEEKKSVIQKGVPKNIVQSHEYLKVKRGEVGRWVKIFIETLDSFDSEDSKNLIHAWKIEIRRFEKIFLKSKTLYDH